MLRKYQRCTQCLVIWIITTVVFMWREPIYDEINMYYLENLQSRLVSPFQNRSSAFDSTCSFEADRRGPGQRIISFSLYGNFSDQYFNKRYLNPLKETVNAVIPKLYPGWIVRIYSRGDEKSLAILRQLFPSGNHIDLCNTTQVVEQNELGDLFPMTWRYLPLLDNLVDVMLSRDADSFILQREVDAVNEWLPSGEIFHGMRDCPYHCHLYILGGMWGIKLRKNRSQIKRVAIQMLERNHYQKKGYDQRLLKKYLWPFVQTSMMVHDSHCCEHFVKTRPFPTQRIGRDFVGMIGVLKLYTENFICPLKCRPPENIHWERC